MSRLSQALASLSEIHAHLAKAEVYQGLRAKPVLLSGLVGGCAAIAQAQLISAGDALAFTWYWLVVAAVSGMVGCSGAVIKYLLDDDDLARKRARIVAGQFAPCMLAGLLLTLALQPYHVHCIGILPGCWAILYGLGLFSARPYLPRATGWVSLYYLTAGTLLLSMLRPDVVPSSWAVAGTFLIGQAGLALVLHRNQQRGPIDGR